MSPFTSRRGFARRLAAGAALPAFSSALAAAPSDDDFWLAVRRQFGFSEETVPLNAANLCPSPDAVALAVAERTRDIDLDCSFQNRAKFSDLLEASRAKVARALNASPDEVALVRNTSEANNIVNLGLPLEAGDEVVLWDQNHPTNNVAWEVRAKRFGFTVQRVSTPDRPSGVDDLAAPFEQALGPKTRVLAVTHASNVSGVRLPVERLAAAARRRGVHFHVDGAQTWGALRVDLKALGCDSYAASAHKWFLGPKEVGLLYVRAELVPKIWPTEVAPGWGAGAETELRGARKFESMGQRDDAALAAIGATADFHAAVGLDKTERRVFELSAALKEGLRAIGAELVTPAAAEMSAGVCIIEVPPENRRALLDAMYREHGIAGSTSGGFRMCPHVYNTREHIERTLRGLRALRPLWARG